MSDYRRLEDLVVYRKLCQLHIEVSALTRKWPAEEKYELGSQARRSSNSSPAQLAEKYDDRHVRNKVEGVNRSRGEAAETIHHLYMAQLKGYESKQTYEGFRERYQECIRMLNGMERTLEKNLPERDRRWPEEGQEGGQGSGFRVQEDPAEYHADGPAGYPDPPDVAPPSAEPLKPEPQPPTPEP
jgi:four helix bundle protein